MKPTVNYLLSAGFTALFLIDCRHEAAQQTPDRSQHKGSFDEHDAMEEANGWHISE